MSRCPAAGTLDPTEVLGFREVADACMPTSSIPLLRRPEVERPRPLPSATARGLSPELPCTSAAAAAAARRRGGVRGDGCGAGLELRDAVMTRKTAPRAD
eukprot:CAMPEP_0175439220 /NCGR_PEP_ID=MMETSP0095-20121207/56433_1 /TAXON_ID=311494 /ORGANISM="Alexandrium monilatum, Strain CCMP3105" /LENGTH=99 /DNA_ID=CAMNT_0016739037 /DNA_START=18 /DNA_END=314 /DNA_ORIENTATION=-